MPAFSGKLSISRSCRISRQPGAKMYSYAFWKIQPHFQKLKMEGFFKIYETLFETECKSASNGQCFLWAHKPQKSGYGAVRYKCPISGQWRSTTAHRLGYMVYNKEMDLAGKDLSHLCHNSLCVRNEHLSAELHEINNERQKCVNRGSCVGHGEYSDCLLHLKM